MLLRKWMLTLIFVMAASLQYSSSFSKDRLAEIQKTSNGNLSSETSIRSPQGLKIVALLKRLQSAYTKGDKEQVLQILAHGFAHKRISRLDTVSSFDANQFALGSGYQVNITLSHLKRDSESNVIFANTIISHVGEFFSWQDLAVFVFDNEEPEKIKGMISTGLYQSEPDLPQAQIYLVDKVSKDNLQNVLSVGNADQDIGDILNDAYDTLVPARHLSVLFLFRNAPRKGSVVETQLRMEGNGQSVYSNYEYKIDHNSQFFVISNDVYLHALNGSGHFKVIVDGKNIAERRM